MCYAVEAEELHARVGKFQVHTHEAPPKVKGRVDAGLRLKAASLNLEFG